MDLHGVWGFFSGVVSRYTFEEYIAKCGNAVFCGKCLTPEEMLEPNAIKTLTPTLTLTSIGGDD